MTNKINVRPDLTGTLYQKYIFSVKESGSYPVEIIDSEELYSYIKIPLAKKVTPLDYYVSKSKYKEWYDVAEEIEHHYSEIISDYNTETINHAGLISLTGIFIEYLIKYELCRRDSNNEILIEEVFYSGKYSLGDLVDETKPKYKKIDLFVKIPELEPIKDVLLTFVNVRNSYIHTNLKTRKEGLCKYLQSVGFRDGYFKINGQKRVVQTIMALGKKLKKNEEFKPEFFGYKEAYLTICVIFEIYKRLYKSRTYVVSYNLFMRLLKKKIPHKEIAFLYYK